MTHTVRKFTIAYIILIAGVITISRCKSSEEGKTADSTLTADSTAVEETADTAATTPTRQPLTVTVTNLKSPDAPVEMSIYKKAATFLDKGAQLKKFRFNPVNGKLTATLEGIHYGEFAIALYQDLNSDGIIDKSVIGIPTEPYAFSNDIKPTIKKPSFDDCKFKYSAKANNISIKLLK